MKTSPEQNSLNDPTIRFDTRHSNPLLNNAKRIIWVSMREKPGDVKLSYGPSDGYNDNGPSPVTPGEQNKRQPTGKEPRTWWVHLWSGLVRDSTGKHHKGIKQAIWLYLYLLVGANWRTGKLFRRIATIASETGFNARTIQRWLSTLRKNGYIKTKPTGRALNILITKWRSISRKGKP